MSALHEQKINETKSVSIKYDNSTQTYYLFYHRRDVLPSELILSYDLNENRWNIDTIEYKDLLENKLNNLFHDKNMSFAEQTRYVINYLDTNFINQLQQQKMKSNVNQDHIYSLSWLRHLRGIRRWASHDILTESAPVLQRYSAPEKSTCMSNNEEIISVKALAESFYTDEFYRNRTKTFTFPFQSSNEHIQTQVSNKPPIITELWLKVITQKSNDSRQKIGCHIEEEKLKNLAEKFITYFGGTFQCNIGHQCQFEYDCQTWHFTVIKVEFLTKNNSQTTKLPKTRIVFLIDDIPHYVRG